MIKNGFILFLLLFTSIIKGQNIDSLKSLCKIKSDTEKGEVSRKIGRFYQNKNEIDSAIFYYTDALNYFNSIEKKCELFQDIGMVYFYNNNFLKTLQNFKISLTFAEEAENDSLTAARYSDIGVVYDYMGAFDKSVENYYKALRIFEKASDRVAMSKIYNNLGIISQNRGDTKTAIELYERSLKLKKETHVPDVEIATSFLNLGSVYENTKEYDKSLLYYYKSLNIFKGNKKLKYLSLALSNIAGVKFYIGELDSANFYINKSYIINDSIKNNLGLIGNYRLKGNVFKKQNNIDSSIFYLKKALNIADTLNVLVNKYEVLEDLVLIYKQNKEFSKAFFLQEELMKIKETLSSEKANNKIETLKIVYETEKKDKEIFSLQKDINKKRVLLFVISVILILISFIIFLFLRQKLIKSKYETDLFNQRLLRLQMNPHFIFNALASIQSYMFEKDVKKAAVYLSSFSKLTRSILNNSREEFITLEGDIETTENYLNIQKMRFENIFNYEIIVDENIDAENVKVPPMLIQPFVENAVIHGFKDIDYEGFINVRYVKNKDILEVVVEDNGTGLRREEEKSHKSHALNITKERLKIINKNKKRLIAFQILNNKKGGVKVVFSIPFLTINL